MSTDTLPAPVIIPASPGWFRLWLDDESGELFGADPLIAWEVVATLPYGDADHDRPYYISVDPITTEGRAVDSGDGLYLLRPDGSVELLGDEEWKDLVSANTPEQCAKRRDAAGKRRARIRVAKM